MNTPRQGTRNQTKPLPRDRNLIGPIRASLRASVPPNGRQRAAFGVSRYTLWRFPERDHMERSPGAPALPQPNAVRRYNGTGRHPRRAARHRPPCADRPPSRWRRREGESRTAHLPSSQRYYLTARGISEAAETFGFDTPSDFMRAYPVSREWLTLLIRRMDAVAATVAVVVGVDRELSNPRRSIEVTVE